MNITVIPDQHGEQKWQEVYNIESDYYVSLGDWFDSFTIPHSEQIKNFNEYMEWVKLDPEHRLTCIGNHDLAYLMSLFDGMSVSGHSSIFHQRINAILNENIEYLKPFYILDGIVFSHAGFSNSWIERFNIKITDLYNNWLNYFKELHFVDSNDDDEEEISATGDNVYQSPLWIRPYSLIKDSAFSFQVVGHTEMCEYIPVYIQNENNKFIFCDSKEHDIITTFNTLDIKDDEKFCFRSIEDYCEEYNTQYEPECQIL